MSMVYNQIYKCRKCGAEFCPVTVHTETIMYIELNNFLNRVNGELEWDHKDMPLAPRLERIHVRTVTSALATSSGTRRRSNEYV